MTRLLLIEDTPSLRDVLYDVLSTQNFSVTAVSSAEAGLEVSSLEHFDIILSDLKLPKKSGLDFVSEFRSSDKLTPIVIMTAYGTIDIAVKALKLGAQDFITKPFTPDFLIQLLRRTLENPFPRRRKEARHAIVTADPKMEHILSLARKVGVLPTPVLILGESGSGKEVIARYIHESSPEADRPFIGVNCASIPKDLMESEFFGHEAGAFTGARSDKLGLFEAANGGTLFLDEIAEMPLGLQVKLLRAIQEGEIRRLGSTISKPVDVRILSATNRNLDMMIGAGEFREDLYYRISVMSIEIPPLRHRPKDVPVLTKYFCEQIGEDLGFKDVTIEPEALKALMAYDWPGNVRELENVLERATIFSTGSITKEHLSIRNGPSSNIEEVVKQSLSELAGAAAQVAETKAIVDALRETSGNKSKAAKALGVGYKTLLSKIKQYDISSPSGEGSVEN